MKNYSFLAVIAAAICAGSTASAQFSIGPLTSFGGANNDGWWGVGEVGASTGITALGNERGLAYGNDHVYLSSGSGAAPSVRILNPSTGIEVGTLDMTGVTIGSANRAFAGIKVGSDGAIYGANLTLNATTAAYKVYRWANEASSPTVVYTGTPLAGARLGDSFDVIGGGSGTRIVAGYGSTPAVAGNNGYAIIDPTTSTATHVVFGGSPPAAGDFRLGLTFGANDSLVIGDQGNSAVDTRYTSYSSGIGSLLGTLSLISPNERHMDFAVVNGLALLATIENGGAATTGTVRVYDVSNPLTPLLLGSAKNQTGAVTANVNGTGGLAWGKVVDNGDGTSTAVLYGMNSNNGLEGFTMVVPEPATGALLGIGLSALVALRRSRK